MDSNFQVKISANISDLQRSIKDAQATLAQLKQTTDGVSGSMRNMEQNTNRGRMVAFAFGQVIRDAGFFSQSFSLGILAISNNIPILIDQLALSIKVLQPFAGALSLIGSLLTAGLTIWAYSSQAVKKYKDEVNEAKGAAMANAAELKSLLSIARDETLSLNQRQDAINRLNDGFSDYNNQLTLANVNSSKNIKKSEDMASVMILEAEAAAIAAQAQAIYAKSIKLRTAPAEELGGFIETLGHSISKLGKIEFDISKPFENVLKASSLIKGNLFSMFNTGFGIYKNFSRARQEVADINEQAKKNELGELDKQAKTFEDRLKAINLEITSKLLKGGKGIAKDSIMQTLNESIEAINLDPSLTALDRVREKINAYQTALKGLVDQNVNQASPAFKKVLGELESLSNQYKELEKNAETLKSQQEWLNGLDKVAESLQSKRLDIAESFGLKGSQKIKQEIEAITDAIRQFEQLGAENPALAQFSNLKMIISLLRLELEKLGVAFKEATNTEIATQNAKQLEEEYNRIIESGIIDTIAGSFAGMGDAIANGANVAKGAAGGFLGAISGMLDSLGMMALRTGLLSIGIGKAIEAIKTALKSLKGVFAIAAGAALIGLAGAARAGARNIAGGGSASGGGAASSTPLGSSFGGIRGATPFPNSNLMNNGQIGNVIAETKISGNDLSILIKRADNNRNEYF